VPYTPHRPFVPERTLSAPRKPIGPAAFRLARPFVHGARKPERVAETRTAADQIPPTPPLARSAPPPLPLVYEPPELPEPLEAIEQYLESEPAHSPDPSIEDYAYDLPPVEHFMDSAEGAVFATGNGEPEPQAPELDQTADDAPAVEWGDTDWAQYDWRAAAALGETGDPAANNAWSDTDWDNAAGPAKEIRETAAKAIADALDGIARRIREGELVIPSPGSVADPAAIAATLAALLGVKR
jgi:hypothetical protein